MEWQIYTNKMLSRKRYFYLFGSCMFLFLCGLCLRSPSKHSSQHHQKGIGFVFYNKHLGYVSENIFKGCEHKCYESFSDYKFAKYVIFLGPKLPWFPPRKGNGQVWILYGHEPPDYTGWLFFWNNVFNWTTTYRRDSDIHYGYGRFRKHKVGEKYIHFNEGDFNFSTNPIKSAWVVSNCRTSSKREHFVNLLNMDGTHYTDVFGYCGFFDCTRNKLDCFSSFIKKYPLYLSFENSMCRDYITEKAFNMLQSNIIPVVRGERYTYPKMLPPYSYVSVHNYENIRSLNNYLVDLVSNKTKYKKMFIWRKHYQTLPEKNIFCELCDYAIENIATGQTKLYEDIGLWYRGDSSRPVCFSPKDI